MTYTHYHIEHITSNKGVDLFLFSTVAIVFLLLKFKPRWINKTGIVSKLGKSEYKALAKKHSYSLGLKEVSKKFSQERASQELSNAKKMLADFRKEYSRLEKKRFLFSDEIKELAGATLKNYYAIERTLRYKAHENDRGGLEGDKELVDFASSLSLRTLES